MVKLIKFYHKKDKNGIIKLNMFNLKLNLFFKEAAIFLLTQALGLIVAWQLINRRVIAYVSPELRGVPPGFSVFDFLLAFLLATIFIVLLLRLSKKSVLLFQIMFAFAVFVGAEVVFETFVPQPWAFFLAVIIALLRFIVPLVWVQNLVIIISIAGVSAWLGLNLSLSAMIIILAILPIYDIIAVYKTKHMVSMFRGLMERGVYFSSVVPEKAAQLKTNLSEVEPAKGFLFLGTGDMAFPLMFAVSALPFKLASSIAIVIGALAGIFAIHLLFITQKERRPMPAMPPIALGAILGFLISILI